MLPKREVDGEGVPASSPTADASKEPRGEGEPVTVSLGETVLSRRDLRAAVGVDGEGVEVASNEVDVEGE